jgi:TolB-like protein
VYDPRMSLFAELKRRNVFRVAIAYLITAWLLIQLADILIPMLTLPEWVPRLIVLLLIILFIPTVIAAWALELTPDGLKLEKHVDRSDSITPHTGKKLNSITIGILALAVVVLLVDKLYLSADSSPGVEVTANKSIAVLPFADLSEQQDQEWFADGLTEEILNSLARLPELQVTARTSSFQFKNTNTDIGDIANQLGVAYIVEGSVRRIGDALRVTAQLIRAHDGFHLWSDTYNRSTEDLFDVQFDVAENIAATLNVILDEKKRNRMFASGTRDVAAFEAYMKGLDLFVKAHARDMEAPTSLADANVYLERAMELDPEYSQPAILHSDRYAHYLMEGPTPLIGDSSDLDMETAPALLRRDFEIAALHAADPLSRIVAEMHQVFFGPHWHRLPGLIDEFRRLVDTGVPPPTSTVWLNEIFMMSGNFELAELIDRNRQRLDPLNRNAARDLAFTASRSGDYAGASRIIDATRRSLGDSAPLREAEIMNEIARGDRLSVIELLQSDFEFSAGYDYLRPLLIALQGDKERAAQLADELDDAGVWPDYFLLLTYSEIGDRNRARSLAARIDALALGPAILGVNVGFSGGVLWFDLDDTPNFRNRLEEAQIDPASLKAWVPMATHE